MSEAIASHMLCIVERNIADDKKARRRFRRRRARCKVPLLKENHAMRILAETRPPVQSDGPVTFPECVLALYPSPKPAESAVPRAAADFARPASEGGAL